ncbi:bone morphogenetic protein 4-like, partial [Anolis carolinensis]|uniref:bone morphogenetic protein 4-like n=1 Tax=Anolis carolinensis TaxID=28377 RepID=UPI002F2B3FFF
MSESALGPRPEPPEFMLDLYRAVAGDDGTPKGHASLPLGNTVRSFLHKRHGSVPGGQLLFVLSGQARKERVLTAELHLFKLRPLDGPHPRRHHVQQVSVYQVEGRSRKKLLCSRLLSLLGSGWEVFSVTQAVRDWTSEEVDMGLAVAIEGGSLDADPTPGVRFASGRDHHPGRKPMLVLFAQDDSPTAPLPNTDPSGAVLPVVPVPRGRGSRSAWAAEEEEED